MTNATHRGLTTGRTIALITLAIAMALLASLLTPRPALSRAETLQRVEIREKADKWQQYAVKFVCGKPGPSVVAPGRYFTAINVHNPHNEVVGFRKKVAVALPGEKPGPISKFFEAMLKPDQALEIDCPDILRHASEDGGFLKGFVVIESKRELDVVAVYTAGDSHVETLHTERVPPRLTTMKARTISGEPSDQGCPPGSRGQRVGNEGCCCNKPMVNPPAGPADWWPDCKPGLECRGNLADIPNGIPANTYSVCVRPPGIVLPPINSSQPPFCGQR